MSYTTQTNVIRDQIFWCTKDRTCVSHCRRRKYVIAKNPEAALISRSCEAAQWYWNNNADAGGLVLIIWRGLLAYRVDIKSQLVQVKKHLQMENILHTFVINLEDTPKHRVLTPSAVLHPPPPTVSLYLYVFGLILWT